MAQTAHDGYHRPMIPSPLRGLAAPAAVAALGCAASGCAEERKPIVIRDGILVLENQTAREWRNVRVTVNDYFTGGVPSLLPTGLMTAPLRDFQTGFGQRFDQSRTAVYKVEVTATDTAGEPVSILWGGDARPR